MFQNEGGKFREDIGELSVNRLGYFEEDFNVFGTFGRSGGLVGVAKRSGEVLVDDGSYVARVMGKDYAVCG